MAELKLTKHLLKKIEELFEEIGYTIRYAKGSFNSGYCMVENQQVAVINKFFDTEGRANVLIEILSQIEVDPEKLSEKSLKTFKQVRKKDKAAEEEETEKEEAEEAETKEAEAETEKEEAETKEAEAK